MRLDEYEEVIAQYNQSKGMGRFYSEAIDDNAQLIHMRFGVPEFNSLTSFFSRMYNTEAGKMANTGSSTGVLFTIGKFAGSLISVPLVPFVYAGRVIRFLLNKPYSKFYYLKPTMPLYWSAVNNLVNALAINMGLAPSAFVNSFFSGKEVGNVRAAGDMSPSALTPEQVAQFNKILPAIFRDDGGIDVRAVATRATRIQNRIEEYRAQSLMAVTDRLGLKIIAKELRRQQIKDPGTSKIADHIGAYHKTTIATGNQADPNKQDPIGEWEAGFFDFLKAEFRDGSSWITLRVDSTGAVSESFSSQIGESALASKVNGASAAARDATFSFAGGNIGDDLISGTIESIIGGVKDFISGVAEGVGMSGLAVMAGKAFVDIPQVWQGSSAELPSSSYNIQLRSPYGNKMSIFLNIYLPMCYLLAAALPISTGKSSYTSPFLLELYDQGKNQIRLGIIDSLSITRGAGNLGWSVDNLPTGVDISFTVRDLSSVMHMPLPDNLGTFDDDSAFTDYIGTLGALSLNDQTLSSHRLKRNLVRTVRGFDEWTDPSYYSEMAANTLPGRILTVLSMNTSRGS